jgi:hypothetical protein
VNVETKEQSKRWMHTHSPNTPKQFKQILSVRKLMAALFWESEGVLMVQFMQQGTDSNARSVLRNTKRTA